MLTRLRCPDVRNALCVNTRGTYQPPVSSEGGGLPLFLGRVWTRRLVRLTLSEGVRLTALMDSCHSGTGLDLPFSWEPAAGRGGWVGGWREETNPYHSLGDVQMISGCEDDDVSCDAAGGRGRTSFFSLISRS